MIPGLSKSKPVAQLTSWIVALYLKLVHSTAKLTIINREHFDAAEKSGKGVILVFWHGTLMLAPAVTKETKTPIYMLISAHRDGNIIAEAVRPFGIRFIRGSAANPKKPDRNKNGATATTQMLAALNEGAIVGFTPDGPRGPAEKVQPGVIRLAQFSGATIIPGGLSASRGKRLGSWDRFFVAWPFAKITAVAGQPLTVPAEIDAEGVEKLRITLENNLKAANARANALGQPQD